MRPSPSAAAALVGGLVLTATLVPAASVASDPGESRVTGPKKGGSASSSWTGSVAFPGLVLAQDAGALDGHTLTVAAPGKGRKAATYFSRGGAVLDIAVTWSSVYNDLDLYVYDEDGQEVASSGELLATEESVSIPITEAGTYTVEVVSFLAEPGVTYDATATLTSRPQRR